MIFDNELRRQFVFYCSPTCFNINIITYVLQGPVVRTERFHCLIIFLININLKYNSQCLMVNTKKKTYNIFHTLRLPNDLHCNVFGFDSRNWSSEQKFSMTSRDMFTGIASIWSRTRLFEGLDGA